MSTNRMEAFSDGVFAIAITLLLLMTVSALPFTTALMAAYLKQGEGESLAAAVYSGSFLLMSLLFSGMNRHILFERVDFLEEGLDDRLRHLTLKRGVVGLLPYALATALAPVSPYVTLAICAAVAVFYASPAASAPERPSR